MNSAIFAGVDIEKLTIYYFRHFSGERMTIQAKTRPDDTRARIIETAEALFRRMGFAKTAVADIAAELGMSPANIYRFFSSKHAIVEAICQKSLAELEAKAWTVARSPGPASQRLEQLIMAIVNYHKDNFLSERRVHDMVLVAIEHSWDVIRAHKQVMHSIAERIVREGVAAGEFEPVDPAVTARQIMRSLIAFIHPVLIVQCLEEHEDLETEPRAHLRFLLRSITPRH
jgi:AcrR family transcriptional regulator